MPALRMGLRRTCRHRSFKEALLRWVKQPVAMALRMSIGPIASGTYRIHHVLNIPQKTINSFLKELYSDTAFWNYIQKKVIEARQEERISGWISFDLAAFLYVLCRIFRPEVIVETGVGPGGSSTFILNALERNKFGYLYSIDLPGYDAIFYPTVGKNYNIHVPKGFNVGWLIPPKLRNRWTLILGDAKLELPKILRKHKVIDMFLHDSLHTYEHMMFEYTAAWKYLSKGGLLLSDDVNKHWSIAFIDFAKSRKIPYCVLFDRLGITKKA